MATIVLDTDALSFVFKADSRADQYRRHLIDSEWAVSFMTVAELDRWAIANQWGNAKRRRMSSFLSQCLICYANRDLCQIWADVVESAQRHGYMTGCADAWIAAVAVSLDAPLLTHNVDDYRGIQNLRLVRAEG